MSVLLAPLLAQVVTLGVTERTDARYLTPAIQNVAPVAYHYEGSARPAARLQLTTKRFNLSLGYGASFTIAALESDQRRLFIYHAGSLNSSYQLRLQRTTITLITTATLSLIDFTQQALNGALGAVPGAAPGGVGAPALPAGNNPPAGNNTNPPAGNNTNPPTDSGSNPPTGNNANPPTGNNANPPASGTANPPTGGTGNMATPGSTPAGTQTYGNPTDRVLYGTWSVALNVSHLVNRQLTVGATTSYNLAGAINSGSLSAANRGNFQLTRGAVAGVNAAYLYKLSGHDALASSAVVQQAWSSFSTATSLQANETWLHQFNKRTTSMLGAGVGVTRTPVFQTYHAYSVFPTFVASLNHDTRLARGTFNASVVAYSAPALDPLRGTVDPRLGTMAALGWTRKRFTTRLVGSAALSLAQQQVGGLAQTNAGALNAVSVIALVGYRISKWLTADANGAMAQQTYYQNQNQSRIPLVYAVTVGLTAGYTTPLWGR